MVQFSFGAPVSDESFFNREDELLYLEKRLFAIRKGSRNDIAVIGPRRVGKSSLILQMAEHARKKGFKTAFLDCEGLDLEGFIKEYGNVLLAAELEGRVDLKIREALRTSASKAIAILSEILGRVKALELSTFLVDFLKFRVEFEQESMKGRASKESLRKLVDSTLSFPSKSDSKFVIIFDEFQETATYRIGKSFHAVFRRITQYQKNVVYVYTGSSIGMMGDIFGNKKNPLGGNADIMNVSPFSEETSKKFISEGFRSYKKDIEGEALQLFWEGTNGFPAYLNWAGIRCLDLTGKRVRKDDVSRVMDEMISPLSPVYQMVERQLNKLGRISKLVLRAISQGYATSSEIADNSPARNVYVYLNRLRKYGLITKSNHSYRIIDPVVMRIVLGY